ncbi:site-2 protease family protein [Populibacterium corticicola]|uniref:Zinc metalloprotease n=1 Tax=Populibacterium corticicola TaxID=1812826 RepID=A0ABW5XCK4_9MICO
MEPTSWTIGRIAGAPINVRPGVLVLIAVFSALYFSSFQTYAGSFPVAVLCSVTLAVLLVISVFLHEVAHVVVARRFKVEAREIGLTFLGGHAGFKNEFRQPWHSFLVSVAGPLANIALYFAMWFGAELIPVSSSSAALAYVVVKNAGMMNLFLGLFNLVPGLPLDGGNALSAIVWQFSKKRVTGMKIAARSGQIVAIGFALYTIGWPMLQGRTPQTIYLMWSVLLVWVVWSGARGALQYARHLEQVERVNLAELVRPALVTSADTTLAQIGPELVRTNAAVLVADDSGRPYAYADPEALYAVPAAVVEQTQLASVIVPFPEGTIQPTDVSAQHLFEELRTPHGVRRLYVLADQSGLKGVVWTAELVRASGLG